MKICQIKDKKDILQEIKNLKPGYHESNLYHADMLLIKLLQISMPEDENVKQIINAYNEVIRWDEQ